MITTFTLPYNGTFLFYINEYQVLGTISTTDLNTIYLRPMNLRSYVENIKFKITWDTDAISETHDSTETSYIKFYHDFILFNYRPGVITLKQI